LTAFVQKYLGKSFKLLVKNSFLITILLTKFIFKKQILSFLLDKETRIFTLQQIVEICQNGSENFEIAIKSILNTSKKRKSTKDLSNE
jgi:hypothetical protein